MRAMHERHLHKTALSAEASKKAVGRADGFDDLVSDRIS